MARPVLFVDSRRRVQRRVIITGSAITSVRATSAISLITTVRTTRLRGALVTAPIVRRRPTRAVAKFPHAEDDPIRSAQSPGDKSCASRVWTDVGGQVQITLIGQPADITVGDEVELLGRLALPADAMSPGRVRLCVLFARSRRDGDANRARNG